MSKFNFQQRVLAGFAFTLAFVFFMAIVSYLSIKELQSSASEVYDTEQIVTRSYDVFEALVNSETSVRGFVITGNPAFLDPYNNSVGKVPFIMQELRQMLKSKPAQLKRLDSLDVYSGQKMVDMRGLIELRKQNYELARVKVSSGVGRLLMNQTRNVIKQIKQEESLQSAQLKLKSDANTRKTIAIIIAGSVIILTLVLILLYFINKTFKKQKMVEERVRHTNSQLLKISKENEDQNWLLKGTAALDDSMRGEQSVQSLATTIIEKISDYVDAHVAAIYVYNENDSSLHLSGSYAFRFQKGNNAVIKIGDGFVGQAALDKKPFVFTDVPANYVKVCSGLGEVTPHTILVQPFLFNGHVKGVIEFGFVSELSQLKMDFITMVLDGLGVAINTAQSRLQLNILLEETQQQAEELESQQEELRTTNDDLIVKTAALQASEEELRVQQEELRQINSELEEKAEQLEEKNNSIEQAREAISLKALELEQTSKYKSEFLANMSHELRTPLNSILILARILSDNKTDNLNEEQLKYSSVIYNAGNDLLTLINDILDLSKIESGKIDLDIEQVQVDSIKTDLELLFSEVANNKKIEYQITIGDDVPSFLTTDRMRLQQILKNLLSNAFKFTPHQGSVSVNITASNSAANYLSDNLNLLKDKKVLKFEVKDSGIGIPADKQKVIFEAFQQADGSTSRKYGGTGLGLSISRELTNILGGEIQIESKAGEGSSFSLFVPVDFSKDYDLQPSADSEVKSLESLDIHFAEPAQFSEPEKEHVMLIIEDDENFAEVLKDYAINRGFKPMVAFQGDTGLEMALQHLPDAIVLDIMLPVMDGWAVLKKLKENPATKNIPVHMMSASDEMPASVKQNGAIGFLKKPVEKEKLDEAFDKLIRNSDFKLTKVLIIEDHEIQSENLRRQLSEHSVEVVQAFDGRQALQALGIDNQFDCIILDMNLPDISGLELLDKIKKDPDLEKIPVIINTAMELDKDTMAQVLKHTHAMVLKNNKSNERLLDEVNLFMNKLNSSKNTTPKSSAVVVKSALTLEKSLMNKTVLIVDDDMRNIFALSSALQDYNMQIEIANNGLEALQKLDENPDINLVLMDIMMPEMDGYEAMQEIRKQSRFAKLPLMALTAKAMKNDREKCIEAGANDYISKPVDINKLVSMMRVWLS
ncbi:response regulator [Daejeonella oryzae]|uniref:response regulator n=1 Tax=Daejeonella oryzae TaxID=1122943 RepID=UPI00041DBE09|nr:response regulator [Daejeonella oryzae]